MNKDRVQLLSPLFLRYQTDYEKNPRSHVFAPLAEMYRKTGMVEKAMEILSQGIKYHPDYLMGHLGLAFCYYDIKQYRLAFTTLRPIVESNRDNIRLQKLFVDVCIALNNKEEALDTCKYLLFINPKDKEIAQKVAMLEKDIEEYYKHKHHPIYIPTDALTEKVTTPSSGEVDYDSWVAVDLVSEQKEENKEAKKELDFSQWNVKKITDTDLLGDPKKIEVKERIQIAEEEDEIEDEEAEVEENQESNPHQSSSLAVEEERSFFVDRQTQPTSSPTPIFTSIQEEAPKEVEIIARKPVESFVTHTLVNLYCGQGYFDKALEVLEKIIQLNPNDEKSIAKKEEILALLNESGAEQVEVLNETEEEGRKSLMDIIDQKLGPIEVMLEEAKSKAHDQNLKPTLKSKKNQTKNQAKDQTKIEEKVAQTITNNLVALKEHSEIKSTKAPIVDTSNDKLREVEQRLNKFLENIQKRALDIQGRF